MLDMIFLQLKQAFSNIEDIAFAKTPEEKKKMLRVNDDVERVRRSNISWCVTNIQTNKTKKIKCVSIVWNWALLCLQMPSERPGEHYSLCDCWLALHSDRTRAFHRCAPLPPVCRVPFCTHNSVCMCTASAQQGFVLDGRDGHYFLHGVPRPHHCTAAVGRIPWGTSPDTKVHVLSIYSTTFNVALYTFPF